MGSWTWRSRGDARPEHQSLVQSRGFLVEILLESAEHRPDLLRATEVSHSVRGYGGERGIRTLEGLLALTPLVGVRLRPLGHLSVMQRVTADVILLGQRQKRDARVTGREQESVCLEGRAGPGSTAAMDAQCR